MKRVRTIVESDTPPEDVNVLWLDTSNDDAITIKAYKNARWVVMASSEIFGNYITPSDLANMFVTLSEAHYAQLESPNPNTYYFTYEEE